MKRGFLNNRTLKNDLPSVNKQVLDPITTEAKVHAAKTGDLGSMKRGFLNNRSNVVQPSVDEQVVIPIAPKQRVYVPSIGDFEKISKKDLSVLITTITPGSARSPTHCVFYPGTKEAVVEHVKDCNFHPEIDSLERATNILVRKIPGQGRGTFAKKVFRPGDHIFAERPILVLPVTVPYNNPNFPRGLHSIMELMLPRLDLVSRACFTTLLNCKSDDPQDLIGIIHTNAVDVGLLPGKYNGGHLGICLQISLINHSCAPNAVYRWDLDTFAFYLTATHPIAVGEQIFVSYLTNQTRTKRQKELRDKYSFTCTCTSCSLPSDLSKRSDIRRDIIGHANAALAKEHADHERALREWAANPSLPDDHILKPVRFIMQLMEEEPFIAFDEVLWLSKAEVACKALCALSDREGVVELARKASAYAKIMKYNDDAGWGKVAASPEKTAWWGIRRKLIN